MADNKHYEVEKILDKSSINEQIYYLIRWKGFGSDWDTWEPVDNLIDCLQLVLDFDAAKERSSQLLDSSLEAVARGIPSPKKDGKTKNKSSSVSKSSNVKSYVSSMKKSPKSPRKSPYKVSVESVKGVKDEKMRKRLAREKGKLFIDMKKETFIPTKNESGQGPGEGESSNAASGTSPEGQKYPKRDSSPRSPQKNEGNISPKKDTENKLKTDDVDSKSAEKDLKTDKSQSSSKKKEEKDVKDTIKKSMDKGSPKGLKKLTKTSASEKVIRDKKYKKSVKYAMKVKLKPTGKVKKESDKKDKKKKDKEEVKKLVQKKVSKEDSKSDNSSEVKKKFKTSQSGKTQKTEKFTDKSTKNKPEGEKAKKGKATKRKVEEDYHIVECSTSDTDDEPLCKMKVKKLKKSSSDSSLVSRKKDTKKGSPKSKTGQDGSNQAVKVKPKQLTVNNVKRKLEVRVQPLGSTSKSKTMRLIDSKKVQPVSPKISSYTTVKPVTISGVGIVNLVVDADLATPLSGDVPGNQYLPSVTPVSPSSVSYKSLLDNMPPSLLAKKGGGKKKDTDDTSEDDQEKVERRISVRQSECAYRYKDIVVRKCQRYTQIWLNTHTKIKNVLNPQVIQETLQALNSAKYDDSSLILFSGLGNVFCNGVDLMFLLSGEKRVVVRQMVDALRDFTKALITFPKPVIAVVNGPAVGLGMAMLPLCDIVYASDKATFYLPYSTLSQTPEGCASYTLPQSVGMAMANELLLAGRKVTAIEACQLGLVSQVFWPTSMMQEVIPKIQNIALHSAKALETTKLLLRSHQRTKLELTCESESNILLERWQSSECQKSIQAFLNKEEIYSS
ncbi:chromodomain Y-like protein 2 isoform X1 [Saccostrea echinata]|uniref:chromodomain Y-like protein 2 isoform X1 n=1 Tax=Saccostrea echinata TaxID=191078 RepID=UPI002A7EED2D|nr:chromodomain Y-like protein 2 isoform X1 [Saccostrea echinata]